MNRLIEIEWLPLLPSNEDHILVLPPQEVILPEEVHIESYEDLNWIKNIEEILTQSPNLSNHEYVSNLLSIGASSEQKNSVQNLITFSFEVNSLKKLLENLNNLKMDCDVIIESSDGVTFQAHKIILAAQFDYFKAIFSNPWNCDTAKCINELQVVKVIDIDQQTLSLIIQFCYLGDYFELLKEENIVNCLIAANHLAAKNLTKLLTDQLITCVNPDNVLSLYNLSVALSISSLRKICAGIILHNYEDLTTSEEYLICVPDQHKTYLDILYNFYYRSKDRGVTMDNSLTSIRELLQIGKESFIQYQERFEEARLINENEIHQLLVEIAAVPQINEYVQLGNDENCQFLRNLIKDTYFEKIFTEKNNTSSFTTRNFFSTASNGSNLQDKNSDDYLNQGSLTTSSNTIHNLHHRILLDRNCERLKRFNKVRTSLNRQQMQIEKHREFIDKQKEAFENLSDTLLDECD